VIEPAHFCTRRAPNPRRRRGGSSRRDSGLDLVHFAKSLNRPLFSRLEISGETTSIACFVQRSNPLVLHPEMKTGRRAYLFP
jgi:hypothetical protein